MKLYQAMAHNIAKQGPITVSYDGRRWYDVMDNDHKPYRTDQLEKAEAQAEAWGATYDQWDDVVQDAVCVLPAREEPPHAD